MYEVQSRGLVSARAPRRQWHDCAVRTDLSDRQRWLDLLAFLVGLAFGLAVLLASPYWYWPDDDPGRSDISKYWAGSRLFLLGLDPFDARTWIDPPVPLGSTLGPWPDPPGSTPPYFGWAVVLMFPLALLPLPTAFGLWTVGGIACAAVATYALLRRMLPGHPIAYTLIGMTLVASQPARLTVLVGQWGFVLTAALAAVIMWTGARHSIRSGLASISFLAKPQLFVLTAPALAIWAWRNGRRGSLAAAVAAGAAIVALSLVLMPGWPAAWLGNMASSELSARPQTTTLAAVFYGFVGQPGIPLALAVIVGCALLALAFEPRGVAWLAVWLPLSLVAAPYVWSYDQTLLVVPLVIGAGVVARRSRRLATGVIATGALTLMVLATGLAIVAARRNLESYSAVIPLVVFALLVVAMWPERRSTE
jgi:glycosyl transferase family 87